MNSDLSPGIFSKPDEEARARILWGENPREVRAWLISQGLSDGQSRAMVNSFSKERNGIVRASGLRTLTFGLALSITGFCLLWYYLDFPNTWNLRLPGRRPWNPGNVLGMALLFLGLLLVVSRHLKGRSTGWMMIVMLAGCVLLVFFREEIARPGMPYRFRGHATPFVIGVVSFLLGLFQVISGFFRWVSGRVEGSLTDLHSEL